MSITQCRYIGKEISRAGHGGVGGRMQNTAHLGRHQFSFAFCVITSELDIKAIMLLATILN